MNKYFILLFALCLSTGIFAQEGFKFGIQGGIPLDDYNEAVSIVLGADFSYMYPLGEVVDIGPAVGYIHGFAETFQTTIIREEQEAVQFLPLSAGVRFWTSNYFSFGGNVGYAMGINDGNEGGLYYRPTIAYLMSSSVEVNFSYTGIDIEETTWSTVTLGIVYNFEPKYRTRR